MEGLYRIIQEISSLISDSFDEMITRVGSENWNRLCTAKDTIDDTCLACMDYEKKKLGRDTGERYLRLYGMLQAIYLQQDSIKVLMELFNPSDFEASPKWAEIRKLRNMTSGHPVDYQYGTKSIFVTRYSISDKSLQLLICDNNEDKSEEVDLQELYDGYIEEAKGFLNSVLVSLHKET